MKKYDSTVARIAGNIAGNLLHLPTKEVAETAVDIARAIVEEVKRTEPLDEMFTGEKK